jgi:arylmalonate decarboxylase
VVAYGCTAAGFIFGPKGDADLAQELQLVTAKPVVTTARSMVLTLQAAGVNDIALVTPYLDAVNTQLKAFLADGGIRVRRFNSFFANDVDALGRITAEQVKEMVMQTDDDGCQAVFIACAQLPTATILEELRAILGKPVFSSNWGTTHQAQLALV